MSFKTLCGGHISFSYCPWYVINIDFMYFSCTVTGSSSNPNFREIILILYLLYVGRRVWRYQREVIMFRKSKKDRQHNNKKKKNKQPSTKHTHKTKDRVTRTPLKTGVNSDAPEELAVPAPLVTPIVNCCKHTTPRPLSSLSYHWLIIT